MLEQVDTGTLYHRQLDIISTKKLLKAKVTLIGCGGIGSPTALALSKMGIGNLILYDADTIETHNLPSQFFRFSDLGKFKVEALSDIIKSYAGEHIKVESNNCFFEGQKIDQNSIVIIATDSLESRKKIFKSLKFNPNVSFVIDARMGLYVAKILSFNSLNPKHTEKYEKSLEGEPEKLPCTAKAVIFNTMGIASFISSQVLKHLKREDLPNSIIFDYVTLTFLQENWK